MKENKVGTYSFVAEPFHVDFTGRLFMGVLGNHLLNCAGFHATERGFGMAELNESNYTWVLSLCHLREGREGLRLCAFRVGHDQYGYPQTGRLVVAARR